MQEVKQRKQAVQIRKNGENKEIPVLINIMVIPNMSLNQAVVKHGVNLRCLYNSLRFLIKPFLMTALKWSLDYSAPATSASVMNILQIFQPLKLQAE